METHGTYTGLIRQIDDMLSQLPVLRALCSDGRTTAITTKVFRGLADLQAALCQPADGETGSGTAETTRLLSQCANHFSSLWGCCSTLAAQESFVALARQFDALRDGLSGQNPAAAETPPEPPSKQPPAANFSEAPPKNTFEERTPVAQPVAATSEFPAQDGQTWEPPPVPEVSAPETLPLDFSQTQPAAEPPPVVIFSIPRWKLLWKKHGGESLLISIAVHAVLLILAYVIVSQVVTYSLKPLDEFDTGAGGGTNGDKVSMSEHRIKPRNAKSAVKAVPKLTVKGAASVSLPEMPRMTMALESGSAMGAKSKGFGGGAGGGIGTGIGPGRGGGRNMVTIFTPKRVMGVEVRTEKKVAVYLDNSGSMVPFLENVKKEIYKSFPDADIFEHNGIFTFVENGKVRGGRGFKMPPRSHIQGLPPQGAAPKLTPHGKSIYSRYATNFDVGSVGAWADIMMQDTYYGALVIFSDFQDGILIDGSRTKASSFKGDSRWVNQFKRADKNSAPRLYLFSIDQEPQDIWQRCVVASGGETKMMPELRNVVQWPPAQGGPSAQPSAATAKKKSTKAKKTTTTKKKSGGGGFAVDDEEEEEEDDGSSSTKKPAR
ncbi:MAG: hypothetical protein LBT53_07855 [Puniceicoccales bacterium]|nr:hypothetical protein [Puniceicoccales bacterium]